MIERTGEMRRYTARCGLRVVRGLFALCIATFLMAGCDSTHPSNATLNEALEALKYRDSQRFASLHVESTERSIYCSNEAMQRLWEKAGSVAESGRCGTLEEVDAAEIDTAPDELRFLLQVVRFRCEEPNASCASYGATALTDGVERSPLFKGKITGWTVSKQLGDEAQSVAYVDIVVDGETEHRAVKMRRVGESWLIESGLLEAP